MIEMQIERPTRPTYDIQRCWLPCCDSEVRLRIPFEDAIHLHERVCKRCDRLWTFATNRSRRGEDCWMWSTSIKLGRPTVPAIEEVLANRNEDGWLDAGNIDEMGRVRELLKLRPVGFAPSPCAISPAG